MLEVLVRSAVDFAKAVVEDEDAAEVGRPPATDRRPEGNVAECGVAREVDDEALLIRPARC